MALSGRGVCGDSRSFENESGIGLNQVKAEGLGAPSEAMEDTLAMALIVHCSGLFAVRGAIAEHAVDGDGELSGSAIDRDEPALSELSFELVGVFFCYGGAFDWV